MSCVPCDLMHRLRDELMEAVSRTGRPPDSFRMTTEESRVLGQAMVGRPMTITRVLGVPILITDAEERAIHATGV